LSSALKHNSFSSGVPLKNANVEAGLLLGGASHPTALWSLDRRFCVFNSAVSKLLGYSEQEINYHPELFLDRVHPEDRGTFTSAWQKLCTGEKSATCRYRFTPKQESETRILHENSFLLHDGRAVLTLYSEERDEGEKVAEARQLRSLLRGISHEIGNNLQAISGELELLKWSGTLPAESAAVVSSAIMQIRALTGDIEEYFFPFPARCDDTDLPSVIANILDERADKIRASGIHSEFITHGTLPSVSLDERFAKTVKTVLDFSCALLAGGGELKIEAGACRRAETDYIEINVVSCCRGVLPIEEDRVFRPFTHFGGYRSGLSMTVARRALRRRSGKMAFRKEDANRGVFSILIPVGGHTL
jgi:nitrogen-specific signal transduction histidine kinase